MLAARTTQQPAPRLPHARPDFRLEEEAGAGAVGALPPSADLNRPSGGGGVKSASWYGCSPHAPFQTLANTLRSNDVPHHATLHAPHATRSTPFNSSRFEVMTERPRARGAKQTVEFARDLLDNNRRVVLKRALVLPSPPAASASASASPSSSGSKAKAKAKAEACSPGAECVRLARPFMGKTPEGTARNEPLASCCEY